MNKKTKKAVGAITGAATLLSGLSSQAALAGSPLAVQEAVVDVAEQQEAVVTLREAESYDKIANVEGKFSFNQDVITPADDVFNLFGTVATGMCAKPGFAFDKVDYENYYINFSGKIRKIESVALKDLQEKGTQSRVLKCSCATGPAIANAQVVGVPFENIVQMVDLEEGANAVTFRSGDGYGIKMPLSYVLEKDAILVYKIGETPVPSGVQIWVPKSVARFFTRNVVDIEFTAEEKEPVLPEVDAKQRAKVNVLNRFEEKDFRVGDKIVFEGYADDYDNPVTAVEFSLDGGETWTACQTEGATAEKWVYWNFGYVTQSAGTFKLDVRARVADGSVSPMVSSVVFSVNEGVNSKAAR
ncbi:MAG: molybdopterin-dependent oxidoreductase [Christensenellales bacterium]|jgi:DMSO/TMAO reductase YedYZ molybdopterin-dependent catalytic subunit